MIQLNIDGDIIKSDEIHDKQEMLDILNRALLKAKIEIEDSEISKVKIERQKLTDKITNHKFKVDKNDITTEHFLLLQKYRCSIELYNKTISTKKFIQYKLQKMYMELTANKTILLSAGMLKHNHNWYITLLEFQNVKSSLIILTKNIKKYKKDLYCLRKQLQ